MGTEHLVLYSEEQPSSMKFTISAVLALVAQSIAVSVQLDTRNWKQDSKNCLCDADASLLATSFGLTISNYTQALAVQLFAEGFTDQSDSVNQLINTSPLPPHPLGTLTFSSKEDFLAGQGAQPAVPFQVLNTWHTRDTVIVRWLSAQKPDQVQGISILTAQVAKPGEGGGFGVGATKYQIIRVLAEFNSGAWLVNLGKPECAAK